MCLYVSADSNPLEHHILDVSLCEYFPSAKRPKLSLCKSKAAPEELCNRGKRSKVKLSEPSQSGGCNLEMYVSKSGVSYVFNICMFQGCAQRHTEPVLSQFLHYSILMMSQRGKPRPPVPQNCSLSKAGGAKTTRFRQGLN